MAGRLIKVGGLAAGAGVGYYLYTAGGDPKLAEKKFEHDAARASAKLRGEVPGREEQAKKAGEESYEAVRAKATEFSSDVKAKAAEADKKFEAYRQEAAKKFEESRIEAGKEVNKLANDFDKKVTEGAKESKSWLSGFFGGK